MGVEPICTVLSGHGVKVAPSTYYAALTRVASARAVRDGVLLPEIVRVHSGKELGRGLYGVRKVCTSSNVRASSCRAARSRD